MPIDSRTGKSIEIQAGLLAESGADGSLPSGEVAELGFPHPFLGLQHLRLEGRRLPGKHAIQVGMQIAGVRLRAAPGYHATAPMPKPKYASLAQ